MKELEEYEEYSVQLGLNQHITKSLFTVDRLRLDDIVVVREYPFVRRDGLGVARWDKSNDVT